MGYSQQEREQLAAMIAEAESRSKGLGVPPPEEPASTFPEPGLLPIPPELVRFQFDGEDLRRDLLRGVDDPGPVLHEVAAQVSRSIRLVTTLDRALTEQMLNNSGRVSTLDVDQHARRLQRCQDVLSRRLLNLQLLIARHEQVVARSRVVKATRQHRRLRAVKAA